MTNREKLIRRRNQVKKAVKKWWTKLPDEEKKAMYEKRRITPEYKAQYTLRNNVKLGKIKREPCEVCGLKAEAHHEDYSKPLEVRWLCSVHHRRVHYEK